MTRLNGVFSALVISGGLILASMPAYADPVLDQGKKIYETTAACVSCHGTSGMGDGVAGAVLNPKPRDFSKGEFKFDTNGDGSSGTEADLFSVVTNGAAKYSGSPMMVGYSFLTEDDRKAVVKYVMSLKK